MDEFDVIIVGAGPAGLSCAIELQKSNLRVLLIEKNKEIGPKICGGGLTTKIKDLGIPLDIAEILFPEVSISIADKEVDIKNDGEAYVGTIDRGKFGQLLLKKLSDKVTVLSGYEVAQIDRDFIVIGDKK